MTTPLVDGQWLDFYALLEVPVNADEDTIRKRIGKVYADASANSEHRDFSRRTYYQALVERVLPQCRRVLLDPEWRAKYDRQHILHGIGDPSAQDYVTFIASMRGGAAALNNTAYSDANLPQRVQDEINLARQVVETARAGAQLELLPSRAVKVRPETEAPEATSTTASPQTPAPQVSTPHNTTAGKGASSSAEEAVAVTPSTPAVSSSSVPASSITSAQNTPRFEKAEVFGQREVETIYQTGAPAHAKTLTAQEAADIRRRRSSNPDIEPYRDVKSRGTNRKNKKKISRVIVEDTLPHTGTSSRLVSPTSLNLMVAITGVLLTITIQKFAMTPAEATNTARLRMVVITSPEIAPLVTDAASSWEQTPEGANFDVIVEPTDGPDALKRVRGKGGSVPDAWIPSNSLWTKGKTDAVTTQDPIAQTPMVLISRSDAAAPLRQAFPNHQITSWDKLRQIVSSNPVGGFGLPDPQGSTVGSLARFSMAREWGEKNGLDASQAVNSPKFWNWMRGFEDQIPTGAFSSVSMVKGIAEGTSNRYKWVIGYESDANAWKKAGKTNLEVFYLPRTIMADYPFCKVNNVRASGEIENGRDAFARYLRNGKVQAALLNSGFQPTESVANAKTTPRSLPREEKAKFGPVNALSAAWAKRNS